MWREFKRICEPYLLNNQLDENLRDFIIYFHNTWFCSRVWHPEEWSVYKLHVRTNNDVEGIYTSSKLLFYNLIKFVIVISN